MRRTHAIVFIVFGWIIAAMAAAAPPAGPATAPAASPLAPGEVRRFEVDRGAAVRSVAFSPDGRLAVSVDHLPYKRGVVRIWDVASGREVRKWLPEEEAGSGHGPFDPNGAIFSPDGRQVLAHGWGRDAMRLWDAGTGELVRRFEGGKHGTIVAAFSPDGKRIAAGLAGDYIAEPSSTLAMWDVSGGRRLHHFRDARIRTAQGVAFTPDGRKVVAGSEGLRVFDAESGKLESSFDGPVCYRISLSADGKRTMTCGSGPAILWDLKSGKMIRRLTWEPGSDPDRPGFVEGAEANEAVFLPAAAGLASQEQPDRAVTASFKGPMVWDLTTGKPLLRLKAHPRYAARVAASPDGRAVLTFGAPMERDDPDAGMIRLWTLEPTAKQ